jgi:hypothetical protein
MDQPEPSTITRMLTELCDHAERLERELEQERQDRVQAEKDVCRALGERNDARAELEQIKAILADPLAVHLNMMRGTIKCTHANLRHLLGDSDPNNLEGPGPTDEERRENARAIQAMSVPERFHLMFRGREGGEV